jgi:hypothetical protein
MSAILESEGDVTAVTRARPAQTDRSIERTEWCLRIGAAACFIGHGAFGIITKEGWLPYFGVVGIGRDLAHTLMPVVGTIDITAGILVLLSPRPAVLLYMAIWGLWTAMLRPLAGESGFETLERAGNYGVPIALLLWYARPGSVRALLQPVERTAVVDRARTGRVLLWATAILLFAHGALQAITQKPSFAALYGAVGLPASIANAIGVAEMIVALLVLVAPFPALLVAIAAWKIASESLFPISGTPIWEFVERGGSYAAPVALSLLCGTSPFTRITFSRRPQ